jgi:hypothetical protein
MHPRSVITIIKEVVLSFADVGVDEGLTSVWIRVEAP